MVIGHLDVSTWAGISIGAVHWYCSIVVDDGDTEVERLELERPLTAKEAATMNKEARAQGYLSKMYSAGNKTRGFNTEEEAKAAGIKYFMSKYRGVLFDSGHACWSAWKKAIHYPIELHTLIQEMNALADKFQALNGYECKKDKMKMVERLDDRWRKKYEAVINWDKPDWRDTAPQSGPIII